MLYIQFVICMMICSFLGIICMIYDQEWKYIIFPLGIILWGLFKFFDDDDREYLKSRGINPDEFDSFLSDENDPIYSNGRDRTYHYKNAKTKQGCDNYGSFGFDEYYDGEHTIVWKSPSDTHRGSESTTSFGCSNGYYKNGRYHDPRYDGMVKKCKRNFKISIAKDGEEQ